MSESSDYDPGPWRGHDFNSAKAHYNRHAQSSAAKALAANVSASDLVPAMIETMSTHPLLIRCDVSGSMSDWPEVIFSKLPYLDHEVRTEYMDEDAEISFGAISDTGDNYPLQIQAFSKKDAMKASLEALNITGGGSGPGTYCEAHAVAALYDICNVHMPAAVIKPPYIIITDEMPYHMVGKRQAEDYAKVVMEESQRSAKSIFDELMEMYEVYVILKPYYHGSFAGDQMDHVTEKVYEKWVEIIGAERIALLPEAGRVVDVIFGILAEEAGKRGYFEEELKGRQTAAQVKTVFRSLETIHKLKDVSADAPKQLRSGKSTLHRTVKGKKTKPLV